MTSNIRNNVDYSPRALYWLGGELVENGDFEWADGSQMLFNGWLPGQDLIEPTKYPTCLGLRWKSSPTPMLPSGLYWAAQKCTSVGGYVCKNHKIGIRDKIVENQTISGIEGRLTSPGYPTAYPTNLDYWIRIIGPERTRLIIQFQKIDLEQQNDCLYDFISLQDYELSLEPGSNTIPMAMFVDESSKAMNDFYSMKNRFKRFSSDSKQKNLTKNNFPTFQPYVRWCGGSHDANMTKFDFISQTNQALLHFHTDFSISGSGFSATWTAIDITG